MENRFILFGYYDHEAKGGWNDHIASFNTLEDAVKHLLEINGKCDIYEIIDFLKQEVVWNERTIKNISNNTIIYR
jgi:hypothetical protein